MEQRICTFCGEPIEPGSGLMFVKKDGSVFYFDRRRCQRSLFVGRHARRLKWTKHFPRGGEKAAQAALQAQAVAAEVAKAEATGEKASGKKTGRDVKVKPAPAS